MNIIHKLSERNEIQNFGDDMCLHKFYRPCGDMVNEVLLEHVAPSLDDVEKSLLEWTGIDKEPHVYHSSGLYRDTHSKIQ